MGIPIIIFRDDGDSKPSGLGKAGGERADRLPSGESPQGEGRRTNQPKRAERPLQGRSATIEVAFRIPPLRLPGTL